MLFFIDKKGYHFVEHCLIGGNVMKKIFVEYFCCKNLGDDLFIKELSKRFPKHMFFLLGNPMSYTKEFGSNVYFHKYSYLYIVICKICSILHYKGFICKILEDFNQKMITHIKRKMIASVYIGGSLFVQNKPFQDAKEIDFSVNDKPNFSVQSNLNLKKGSEFLVGANLGPCYSECYWSNIEQILRKYKHVCLRDYSSYCKMRHMSHVQYAPDVAFNVDLPLVAKRKRLVISLIAVENCVKSKEAADAYYKKIAQVANYYIKKGFKVTAIAFCEKLGDVKAINRFMTFFESPFQIERVVYNGNIQECLDLIASAQYVVGTRFHSVIMALHFGKPVLPIVYNSKTSNYLYDVNFKGKVVHINEFGQESLQDLISNFTSNYIVDCEAHRKYAVNQFYGLEKYLENVEK